MSDEVTTAPDQVDTKQFKRGAKPTPPHILAAAQFYCADVSFPTQAAWVPPHLSVWGNDQYGDCVTAEEAFARACYSPEIFISDQEVIRWAGQYDFLNGAFLPEVMHHMQKKGFQQDGHDYGCGRDLAVVFSDEGALQGSIAQGPVKIAIDAGALPQTAGNHQGWHAVGGSPGQYPNTDHCVSICGYGPAEWLYSQLNVPLPEGLPATGYLLFTWGSIGFVDHAWIMSTCTEAWLRDPTTVVDHAPGPKPPPPPPPTPTPWCHHLWNLVRGVVGEPRTCEMQRAWDAAVGRLHRSGAPSASKDLQRLCDVAGVEGQVAVSWSTIVALATIVFADVAAGKTAFQIVQDIIAYLTTA